MFGPLTPVLGGALIGLAASLLLLTHGKVAGISGIFGGLLKGEALSWRAPFTAGLLLSAPLALLALADGGALFANTAPRSAAVTVVAGLLVGAGSRMGNGCTSGHGVCGLARGSRRSLAATVTFMTTAALMAYAAQRLLAPSADLISSPR
ncbi:MAG: YeeE/YedE family protein [Deltaproteobacteria bacterium]|nr:YeeE/YedE family protein [Deltaproteobacteria bacterium]